MEKILTFKQVVILVLTIIAGIAFIETNQPIWTLEFLRDFGLRFLIYSTVSEFIVIVLAQQNNN